MAKFVAVKDYVSEVTRLINVDQIRDVMKTEDYPDGFIISFAGGGTIAVMEPGGLKELWKTLDPKA